MPATPPITDVQTQQPKTTPQSQGSGSQPQSFESSGADHGRHEYDKFLEDDLKDEYTLSFDDFMEYILNCPNYLTVYSTEANKIAKDATFIKLRGEYPTRGHEMSFYHAFVRLANHILRKFKKNPQIAFCRNDPQYISGSLAMQKPDVIVALWNAIFNEKSRINDDNCAVKGSVKFPFHWGELLGFGEFKLISGGGGPQPAMPSASVSRSSEWTGDKRSAPVESGSSKRSKTDTSIPKLQSAGYALELLSNGGLRTHVLGLLVTKSSLQLLYYDRSVVIISESLDFKREDNAKKFIALILTLEGLSPTGWGFLPGMKWPLNSPSLETGRWVRAKDLFSNRSLQLRGNGAPAVKLGNMLSRYHGLIGRGTCVIDAKVENAPEGWPKDAVVKISSPAVTRKSECDFLKVAREVANIRNAKWVPDHLPNVLYSEDLDNSTREKLSAFLNAQTPNLYELRALRVIVFDKLLPITELKTAAELATALRGIFKCYRWLYEEARILHRDISLYNLMYRTGKAGKIYGVLNDFDLASFVGSFSPSSKQRTGTQPYMACDLLMGEARTHHYRHDLESLFYVIIIITSHFQDGKEIPDPPMRRWYTLDRSSLSESKYTFISRCAIPPPTLPFKAFELKWLKPMCTVFREGQRWAEDNTAEVSSETLGSNVTFDKIGKIFETAIE